MDASVELIILDRLKEIDSKVDSIQTKLVSCETKLDDVVGAEQPGRLKIVEEKVYNIEKWRSYVSGISSIAIILAAVTAVVQFGRWLFGK